jgi:polyamine oxidase
MGDNIVICVVTGEEAKRIELLSDRQVADEIQDVIYKAYRIHSTVQDIHIPRWNMDSRFYGSYSFFAAGALKDCYEEFYAPVNNIHFAGEAFCKNYKGFVHSAYKTGEDAANAVINQI